MPGAEKIKLKDYLCLIIEDQKPTAVFLEKTVQTAFPQSKIEVTQDIKSARLWLKNYSANETKSSLSLVLVDLGLPDGSGVEIIREIKKQVPQAHVVVVTIYDDDAFLFKALEAGASGYILKQEEPQFLVDMLKRIEKNEPPLSPSIARRILNHFRKDIVESVSDVKLSPRELETLILLSRGLTVAEVAQELKLSAQTVAGYVKVIYQKLHVSNRVELVREAHRRGLL